MTDWLAQIGGVSSALAGLDMAMPGDGDIPLLGLAYWAYDLSTSVLVSQVPGKHSLLFVVLRLLFLALIYIYISVCGMPSSQISFCIIRKLKANPETTLSRMAPFLFLV